jgi:hypothetical protein
MTFNIIQYLQGPIFSTKKQRGLIFNRGESKKCRFYLGIELDSRGLKKSKSLENIHP